MGKRRSKAPKKSAKAQKWKYQLSVGIIFKNEIRCLERCLTSLLPLKKSLSCEIVMADTGATDGSREIAEKYADVVFDFPWINDFSAARNAVLERCSGEWFLCADCDEWFEDVTPLVRFLNGRPDSDVFGVTLTARNYYDENKDSDFYADSVVCRVIRMSAKPRFEGAIHERLVTEFPGKRLHALPSFILRHDGYVCLNNGSAEGAEKRKRNMEPIRKELEQEPENLRALSELIDIARYEPDYLEVQKYAVSLIKRKAPGWDDYGPLILSRVTLNALRGGLSAELKEWAELAEAMFPDSYFTRIDVNCALCSAANQRNDFPECVRRGQAYLAARKALSGDNQGVFMPLKTSNDFNEKLVRMMVCRGIAHTGNLSEVTNCVKELRVMLREAPELTQSIQEILEEIRLREPEAPPEISPELRELAEKVRALLAAYPPDDPAVVALKATPAYQKVAHLI